MYQAERFTGAIGNFTTQQQRVAYWEQPGRIDELKDLNKQGLSASQIAKRLGGVTRNAVIGKLHRLGIASGARVMRTYPKPKSKKHAARKPVRHKGGPGNMNTETLRPKANFHACPLPPEPERPAKLFKLVDLEDSQCRYFFGDPRAPDSGFCGCEKMAGSSYCPGHHGKVYEGVPVRTRSKPGKHAPWSIPRGVLKYLPDKIDCEVSA
jgi:GcrA cell cycle regulator